MASTEFDNLVADFEFIGDWEERYKYLIELGRQLPSFDDEDKTDTYKVQGCASQVWLKPTLKEGDDGTVRMLFIGDSDALIVKGLIQVLRVLINDLPVDEIVNKDAQHDMQRLGLSEHLTPQRSNGLASMIRRIKDIARAAA